jgi:hypothetical protein
MVFDGPGNNATELEGDFTKEDLLAIDRRLTRDDPLFNELMAEIAAARTAEISHTDSSGVVTPLAFEHAVFNRRAGPDAPLVLVMLGGFDHNFLKTGTARGLAAMAMRNPEQQYMVGNAFGSGGSSELPPTVFQRLTTSGSYVAPGALFTQAVFATPEGQAARSDGRLRIAAESRGARLAAGALAAGGLEVEVARLVAAPGHIGGLGELFASFATEMNIHAPEYDRLSIDPHAAEFADIKEHPLDGSRPTSPSQERITASAAEAEILAREGFDDDLEAALDNITNRLDVVSLSADELSDLQKRYDLVARLATLEGGPRVITHIIAHGLSHLYGGGSPGARAILFTPETL